MAATCHIRDLEGWDARIRAKAAEFGLDWYPQEFELCDHVQMLGAMAYSGMPSHYPHWSYGKAYERLKTLYDHGVSGLPYEMVINADPAIAYLMRDNSLCLQVLTIAHVYAHNDFFKNNFTFRHLRPELVVRRFKIHADRVRRYAETPSIGEEKVEALLDAAHALMHQCRRNPAIRKLGREEQEDWLWRQAEPPPDPFRAVHRPPESEEPDLHRLPLEPEEDILLFVRDHNPRLAEWERDLLTMVHEEAMYFLPQIETKIINEGWASYWHRAILNSLELPHDLHMEFLVRHNQVVRAVPGTINPYYLGFQIWQDIERRVDEPTDEDREAFDYGGKSGRQVMFEVREVDRDVSFLRRFLTEKLMRDADLFQHEEQGDDRVVTRVSDGDNWRDIKETLLQSVGLGSVPVIKVVDADHDGRRTLFLRHDHDGRDLDPEHAERTLAHLYALWGRKVVLETTAADKRVHLWSDEDGFGRDACD